MTLFGIVIQAGLSGALTLAPAAVLKKDHLRASIAFSFFAIFAASRVGGLVLAIPVTILLVLYSLWVRFVGNAENRAKSILFAITWAISALFLAVQVIHLPIRFALDQPPVKIAANIAGIFLAAALLCTAIEFMILRRRKCKEAPNQAMQPTDSAGG